MDPCSVFFCSSVKPKFFTPTHELGTSQDSLETSQDGLGCVFARPCMSRQVTETEREIPFFSHRLVAAVDFISRDKVFSPSGDKDATKLYWPVPACPS